jgi:YHS domain-containing protein
MSRHDRRERPEHETENPSQALEPSAPTGALDQLASRFGAAGMQRALQRRAAREPDGGDAPDKHERAQTGLTGAPGQLPHLDRIQASFGRHDPSGIEAHVGGAATEASEAIGARAYATGNSVAFREAPDLHTAAHEAAHVVQQRAGVQLKAGVGQEGDAYERHADEVADLVVAGKPAEQALDKMAGAGGGGGAGLQLEKDPKGKKPDDAPRSFEKEPEPGTYFKDPVAGDVLLVGRDTSFAEYQGRIYAFGDPECKDDFERCPEKYAEAPR